ncbi:MAG: PhzF family phenazine biosynthesis isomerase, partial [Bacilli bacterium]|nr:PhzF family phenazine biosynthesis isomerase [Bacilli bacterium]
MHVYEVSAFTRNDKGGNLAGVIILEDQIDDNLKQEMAAKLNYSETVFVEDIGDNHFNISFFTPNQEVNLCGHGTIACFWLLNKLGLITQEVAFQHTKQGILKVIVKDNILMEMSSPKRLNNVSKDITALLLNINTNEIINIPQVIEVGLADCMVIVKDLATLNKIVINKDAMIKYCNENDF